VAEALDTLISGDAGKKIPFASKATEVAQILGPVCQAMVPQETAGQRHRGHFGALPSRRWAFLAVLAAGYFGHGSDPAQTYSQHS